ncbi:hypothetical protein ACVWWN_000268 [Mycobacterium sp. URHB0021]
MHPLARGGQVRRTRALRQLARRADASSSATSPLAALNRKNGMRFGTFRHTRAWRRPADRASASPRPLSFGGQAVTRIGRSGRTRRTALGHGDIRRPGCERFAADLGSAHADRQLDCGGVPHLRRQRLADIRDESHDVIAGERGGNQPARIAGTGVGRVHPDHRLNGLVETSAILNGRRDLFRPTVFQSLWLQIEDAISDGQIRSIDEV